MIGVAVVMATAIVAVLRPAAAALAYPAANSLEAQVHLLVNQGERPRPGLRVCCVAVLCCVQQRSRAVVDPRVARKRPLNQPPHVKFVCFFLFFFVFVFFFVFWWIFG